MKLITIIFGEGNKPESKKLKTLNLVALVAGFIAGTAKVLYEYFKRQDS